jgi:hypothetical protein
MADQIIQDQQFEIARLKDAIRRLAEQDATLSVCDGDVTVTMDATLTDEERTFLRMVRDTYAMQDDDEVCGMIAASITGLLERTR